MERLSWIIQVNPIYHNVLIRGRKVRVREDLMMESEVGEKDTRRHYPAGLEDRGRDYEQKDAGSL